jgi:hypothetical protein
MHQRHGRRFKHAFRDERDVMRSRICVHAYDACSTSGFPKLLIMAKPSNENSV